VEPAVAPHTRPDRLFGDVQVNRNAGSIASDTDEPGS